MSQKAMCPRGHIWDPSTLAGLPAEDRPHCPICGEAEAVGTRKAIARMSEWGRTNPTVAALSAACLGLGAALIGAIVWAMVAGRNARNEAEVARHEAELARVSIPSHRKEAPVPDDDARRMARQQEMEAEKWRGRFDELKGQLRDAQETRSAAVKQRDEQARARKVAEDLARTAEEVRRDAVGRREEAARLLVKMHVAAGTRLMEGGDLSASLPWFAEALRLAQKERMPEETHRMRLAAVLGQCPRPAQVWPYASKINVVQLSPDGKRVLTAGADGAVEVRDAATGKRVGEPLAHDAAVTLATFAPDGKQVLTAAADMTVHIWDLDTGKEAVTALEPMAPVIAVAFSPDGRHFLTVTNKSPMDLTEGQLQVWDAATGAAVSEEPLGSEISPRPAIFSPDGKRVLTICQDRCARLWDVATEKQVGTAFGHDAAVIHVSFGAGGERVLTASADGTARVWRANTGEPVTPPLRHGSALRAATLSPDGRHILTVGDDRSVRVWSVDSGASVGPSLRHSDAVSLAAFSPDGRYILTACEEGAVRLWDYVVGAEVVPALRHGGPIQHAAFAPSGDTVMSLSGRVVRLWDLTAGEPPMPPPARAATGLEVFSADGRRVLRANGTTARIYDTDKNQPVGAPMPHKDKVTLAAFSADGRRVLTVSHRPNGDELEGHVRVWDAATGGPIGEALVHPRSVLEAGFSPNGQRVLTACQDRKARLWEVDKGTTTGEPMDHKEDLVRALFIPSGRRMLTVDAEGGMRLWDTEKAEAVGPTWGHKKPVNHLAFSGDGRLLVTACEDGTARVWEADSGQEIAETPGHGATILHAAFSPDARRIVTIGGDRAARVWDATNGKPLTSPLHHPAAVTLGAFSEDGRWLLTVAADRVRVWDAASGEAVSPLLKHSAEQPIIRGVELGRDGRLVVRVGAAGDPAGRWTRELRPDTRPAGDLLRVAEVLVGQRPTGAGEMASLDSKELNEAWQQVQKKYGKEFAPAAGRRTAWQRRGAVECEHRQLWAGAVNHLDRLIVAGASADLYARRGRANAELNRWAAARADYTKALQGEAERWDLWAGRAEVESGEGRWEQAVADYTKAIEQKGDRAELWVGRGRAEAERRLWDRAAADFAKAIHLGAADVSVWQQHALALLAGGEEANYRRACSRLMQRFGNSKDEATARAVAWTCALVEGAVRDLQPLVQRAERAVTARPQSADDLRRLALLLYRSGRFDAAQTRLEEITRMQGQKPEDRDYLLLALCARRLGRGEEAKKWLDKTEAAGREKTTAAVRPWQERLIVGRLHDEAETLRKGTKP